MLHVINNILSVMVWLLFIGHALYYGVWEKDYKTGIIILGIAIIIGCLTSPF